MSVCVVLALALGLTTAAAQAHHVETVTLPRCGDVQIDCVQSLTVNGVEEPDLDVTLFDDEGGRSLEVVAGAGSEMPGNPSLVAEGVVTHDDVLSLELRLSEPVMGIPTVRADGAIFHVEVVDDASIVTVSGSPADVSLADGDCCAGPTQADIEVIGAFGLLIADGDGDDDPQLAGSWIAHDASHWSLPHFEHEDTGVALFLGAPSFASDGQPNTGFVRLFLPPAALSTLGFLSNEGLTAADFTLERQTDSQPYEPVEGFTAVPHGDGVLIELDPFGYSDNTFVFHTGDWVPPLPPLSLSPDTVPANHAVPLSLTATADGGGFDETTTVELVDASGQPRAVSGNVVSPTQIELSITEQLTAGDAVITVDTAGNGAQGVLTVAAPVGTAGCLPEQTNDELTNLGFEAGTLEGWTTGMASEGISVVNADAFSAPYEGDFMARLGATAPDEDTAQEQGPNQLCQDFVVTQDTVRFAYNLFTYDYTGFDDFQFSLVVVDPDTGDVVAHQRQGAWGVGTQLKKSGWRGVELDLSDHIGQTMRLYFNAGGTMDEQFAFWVYLDSASGSLPPAAVPVATVDSSTGTWSTDPATGAVTVTMPTGDVSDLSIQTQVTCADGEAIIGDPVLVFNGRHYVLDHQGGSTYSAVIPAADIAEDGGGDIAVQVQCDDVTVVNTVGTLTLYDPSGIITDAVSGLPVVGATVQLHKVPGWLPKSGPSDAAPDTCQSHLSKEAGEAWDQPAPTHLGRLVSPHSPEISPNVNPFITNNVGYYGWNVAQGCWYVVVSKPGYQTLTSPVVGVPPEVTDLHLALTPLTQGGESGGGGQGGGGASPGAVPVTAPADPSTPVVLTVDTPAGPARITLIGVTQGGTLSVTARKRSSSLPRQGGSPVDDPAAHGLTTLDTWFDVAVDTVQFGRAELCLPFEDEEAEAAGISAAALRLYHVVEAEAHDVTTEQAGALVCGSTTSFSPFVLGAALDQPSGSSIERRSGGTRFETAAAVSRAEFPAGADTVYLATGESFADALAGSAAAGRVDAPILLAERDRLPAATAAELRRLDPSSVIVLGGPAALSDMVTEAVTKETSASVRRISGADRYGTAASVSQVTFADGADKVYVASGEAFPDALSGTAVAIAAGAPMLLVGHSGIPESIANELRRLDPERLVLLGGTAAISEQVAAGLQALTGAVVQRVKGDDRYGTAAAAAGAFDSPDVVYLAGGEDFADVLAGGVAAGRNNAPLLLTSRDELPPVTAAALRRLRPDRIVVLGGVSAVSRVVVDALAELVD